MSRSADLVYEIICHVWYGVLFVEFCKLHVVTCHLAIMMSFQCHLPMHVADLKGNILDILSLH